MGGRASKPAEDDQVSVSSEDLHNAWNESREAGKQDDDTHEAPTKGEARAGASWQIGSAKTGAEASIRTSGPPHRREKSADTHSRRSSTNQRRNGSDAWTDFQRSNIERKLVEPEIEEVNDRADWQLACFTGEIAQSEVRAVCSRRPLAARDVFVSCVVYSGAKLLTYGDREIRDAVAILQEQSDAWPNTQITSLRPAYRDLDGALREYMHHFESEKLGRHAASNQLAIFRRLGFPNDHPWITELQQEDDADQPYRELHLIILVLAPDAYRPLHIANLHLDAHLLSGSMHGSSLKIVGVHSGPQPTVSIGHVELRNPRGRLKDQECVLLMALLDEEESKRMVGPRKDISSTPSYQYLLSNQDLRAFEALRKANGKPRAHLVFDPANSFEGIAFFRRGRYWAHLRDDHRQYLYEGDVLSPSSASSPPSSPDRRVR